ncbi:MAG: UDP-glucose/GDP-mannose dehydrogenase family protein [Muribaculaceae bacterium]|nr:UDP-glucose/GDP-mannose dehydrogenase family protein [Muribaculaceae bacterium]
MNISIVGTGYVGLVTGTCFAELGVNVTCVDTDNQKINRLIYGAIPIYEPGLENMVTRNVNDGRLRFVSDFNKGFDNMDYVFCAIDTMLNADGSTDLTPVLNIARLFGQRIDRYSVFVLKSTVPVGTAQEVKEVIAREIAERGVDVTFDIASNPDFLTEGNAIKDFMKPDRVIVGVETEQAREAMARLYRTILHHIYNHVIYTDTRTAEMIKYAATSMLATRVSFMNEIANLCEIVGADVNTVRHGVGTDSRIGPKYIFPGCGYGGTLFPQDIKDLIKLADGNNFNMEVLKAVDSVNTRQKRILFEKLSRHYGGDLKGKTVALWGLSFKPETDDMSEAPSIVTIDLLMEAGCQIRVYDPVAMNAAKQRWADLYCGIDMYDAVKGADALLLLTEWRQFRIPAWDRIHQLMRTPLIIDGRNIYDRAEVESHGFDYRCIGR